VNSYKVVGTVFGVIVIVFTGMIAIINGFQDLPQPGMSATANQTATQLSNLYNSLIPLNFAAVISVIVLLVLLIVVLMRRT